MLPSLAENFSNKIRLVPKVTKPRPRAKVQAEDLEHSREQGPQQHEEDEEEDGAIMENVS